MGARYAHGVSANRRKTGWYADIASSLLGRSFFCCLGILAPFAIKNPQGLHCRQIQTDTAELMERMYSMKEKLQKIREEAMKQIQASEALEN